MGTPAQAMGLVTVGNADVTWDGLGMLASIRLTVTSRRRKATKCARILKILFAPTQVPVTVAGVSVMTQMEMDSFMVNFVSVMIENA